MITRDTAISAGLRQADWCYSHRKFFEQLKHIYQNRVKMEAEKLKEELLSQIYNRMAWNGDPEIIEAATKNIAIYVVDLMLFERKILNEAMDTPGDSMWQEVRNLL